jgi:DnaJ family protein C protein 11
MNEKRAEAEGAVTLMSMTYARIKGEEEAKSGLVIISAMYGRIIVGSGEPEAKEHEVIVVTVPLQCLVRDSALILYKGSKVRGIGIRNTLPIRYFCKIREL